MTSANVDTVGTVRMPKRLTGYINKIERRTIGGPYKKRYWFVLSDDSPYLYYYKNKGDISCTGRIPLSGAAFTFDPREGGRFEIHVSEEIYILETEDNKSRLQWLQQLQSNRRRHYERGNVDDLLKVEIVSLSSHSHGNNEEDEEGNNSDKSAESSKSDEVTVPGPPEEKSLEEEILDAAQSIFYVGSDGALNGRSLEMPQPTSNTDVLKNAEELLSKIAEGTQAKAKKLEQPARKVIGKAKATLRLSSGRSCEQCQILIGVINALKDRCYELTDEAAANQDLIAVLRQSLLKSNRQVELMKRMEELKNPQERINMILEKESELTDLQLNAAAHAREIRTLREKNRQQEERLDEMQAEIEAFRESVRSKEELILKIYDEKDGNAALGRPVALIEDVEVPEGILVDFGTSLTDENAQRVFDEASVNDVTEMRDLVEGYRSQNMFLNQEVLELQKIVQSLEERERRITRQNFDIEACYYQLKSRYIMVLNHFRCTNSNSRVLQPGVIEALIDEANWTTNHRTLSNDKIETRLTDSLGFYLNDDNRQQQQLQSNDMLDVAAELKNKSDEIVVQQEMEQSPQYIDWLQKWDSFVVNTMSRPLKPSIELKNLIRSGVPKTYRRRIWKNLVNYVIGDQQADLGNGYYEAMLRKVKSLGENAEEDSALKQIDLDLARTLPTNKYFDQPTSEKIAVLRRVLYAYRFHNKLVGYCQGLNRLAAVTLLFLDEVDSFWFLVACVEHLQPAAYYTPTLHCAVADQRVLRDLVSEKLPKLSSHLKKYEVDLSAFTLSWFLTCYVDIFPHTIYLNIFDVFLYEGNKVLFRFALAVLKLAETSIIACKSIGAVHASLSRVAQHVPDFKTLAQVAFNELNPFPQKVIEAKRQFYLSQMNINT